MDLRVTGADDLAALSKRLREAGNKDLRRELFRGIQRTTKPVRLAMSAHAGRVLPQRGGLAAKMARSRFSTKTRTGRNPGVVIAVRNPIDVRSIDRGRVRHLTFGHRPWKDQAVAPGAFTEPFEDAAPVVRRELLGAMAEVAGRV